MAGETNLETLLGQLNASMRPELYVFCTVKDACYGDMAHTQPLASFLEEEGLTLVMTQAQADKEGLPYQGTFCCISLCVHSSLEAVGLTAIVASALAAAHISANMMAGHYHDHIFIPSSDGEAAFEIINALQMKHRASMR